MDARDPHVFIGLKTCGGDNIREPRNTTQPALLMLKIPSERLGERKHTMIFSISHAQKKTARPKPSGRKQKQTQRKRANRAKAKRQGRPKRRTTRPGGTKARKRPRPNTPKTDTEHQRDASQRSPNNGTTEPPTTDGGGAAEERHQARAARKRRKRRAAAPRDASQNQTRAKPEPQRNEKTTGTDDSADAAEEGRPKTHKTGGTTKASPANGKGEPTDGRREDKERNTTNTPNTQHTQKNTQPKNARAGPPNRRAASAMPRSPIGARYARACAPADQSGGILGGPCVGRCGNSGGAPLQRIGLPRRRFMTLWSR